MLFAGWEVRMVKTVTEVLKILPETVGRGQHFFSFRKNPNDLGL